MSSSSRPEKETESGGAKAPVDVSSRPSGADIVTIRSVQLSFSSRTYSCRKNEGQSHYKTWAADPLEET